MPITQSYALVTYVDGASCTLKTCSEESRKKLYSIALVLTHWLMHYIRRRQDPIIAIGGGVCLDVTGLAANLYRRNTSIIKVRLLQLTCQNQCA